MKTKRRLLGLLLCSAVLFSLCTPPAFAETQAAPAGDGISVQAGNEDVGYIDADGNPQSATATVVESNMTNWGMDTYVVNSNVTIDSRVSVGGEAYLILADGCELTVSEGIIVDSGSTLIIYAQSTGEQMGTLKATAASSGNAGIGGTGIIVINGGKVEANGSGGGAGIGCGYIEINGGMVTATGNDGGAGIGGGRGGTGGDILICGGTVEANGKNGGAGIGGGDQGAGGRITIRGGTVVAKGSGGAGIGGGMDSSGGNITISGGTVDATSIGGGYSNAASGTFSTPNGNAVIFASSILGGSVTEEEKANWRGMIFERNNGAVYGNDFTLSADMEIPAGKTLTIEAGKTLTIEAGVTLTNYGTIVCAGRIIGDGSLSGSEAIQAAPAAPVVKNTTIHSVELEAVAANSNTGAAAEYSRDNGANWQDSPVFTGLKPNTEYTFVVRYKGADPFFAASPPSNATTATTDSEQHTVSVSAEPAEGGTASSSLTSAKQGEEITLTAIQSNGWHFKEWRVISGGVTIRDNKFIMPAENVIVKAVFEKDSGSGSGGGGSSATNYTVSVSAEPAEGGTASASLTSSKQGEEITLTATRNRGWHFKEWRVISGGVTIRDNKFIMPAGNVIVKAVFEKDSGSGSGGGNSSGSSSGSSGSSSSSSTTNYTLTFESNGGSAIEKVTETSGKIIDLSGYRPTREGYDFNGWYLDKELTRKITEIRLDGNKTVYAGWTEHKTNSGISTPDSNRKSPPTGEHGARLGRQTQKPQIWRERPISKKQKKGIPV